MVMAGGNGAEDGCAYMGHEWFPQYGVGPHSHDLTGGTFIGSTRLHPKHAWPANYREDPETPGCGVYECPGCGPKQCHNCGTRWTAPIDYCPECPNAVQAGTSRQ